MHNLLTENPKSNADDSKTILVVEDDSIIRAFTSAILKRNGFRVLTAADGIEGSVAFAREYSSIDLLLTDLSLPGMRGDDLAKYARKLRPDIQVLIASGSVQSEDFNLVAEFLGSKFLAKPFTSQELIDTVNGMFETTAPLAPKVEAPRSII